MKIKWGVLLMALFVLAGCANRNLDIAEYQKKGKIILGTNAQLEPFSYYKDGAISGIDINIAKKVARKLNVELEIKDMNFESLKDNLLEKNIDFVIGGISKENKNFIDMGISDSYYETEQVAVVLRTGSVSSMEDLKGMTVGIQKGRIEIEEAERITKADIREYNTGAAALLDLKDRKIDAVIFDEEAAEIWEKDNPDVKILEEIKDEEYVVMMREGESELKKVVNEVINEMKMNGELEEENYAY